MAVQTRAGSIELISSTNALSGALNGPQLEKWRTTAGGTGQAYASRHAFIGDAGVKALFGNVHGQLFRANASDSADIQWAVVLKVNPSKPYRIGGWMGDDNGANIAFKLTEYNASAQPVGGLPSITITKTPVAASALTASVGAVQDLVSASGGTAPAWNANTRGMYFILDRTSSVTGALYIFALWFIREEQFPSDTATNANSGFGGTHEAATDGTYLYTVSHSANRVCKFDSGLIRQGSATVSSYPHDILVLNGKLWVITNTGTSLHRINASTMAVEATYPLLGSRNGYGVGTDGTFLFLGAEAGANAALIKFDMSVAVDGTTTGQSVLSTDVSASGNNLPVVCLSGSVWSAKYGNGELKRIDAISGATLATVSIGQGGLYGLGTDGTYLYTNSTTGVSKVDPVTNTVVASWTFREGFIGATNLKFDNGRMWGMAQGGSIIFYLDIALGRLIERLAPALAPKWCQPFAGDVVAGYFMLGQLDSFAAGARLV